MGNSNRFDQVELAINREERLQSAAGLPDTFFDYLPLVSPPIWSFNAPHLRLIADCIDAMRAGDFDRLAIFMPPRHSKTETCTVRAPAFLLDHDPSERILVTGYNERAARRFSRKTRTIIQERIPLAGDKTSVDEWETTYGGGLVARGVGTPPMGFGFGWIFIDDPIKKREEAESEVYREKVWDWYTDDLYTRLEPGGKIVMTLTRWHHDDVAARALASEPGKWRVLRLPALAEENDPLGRQIGEALWPERFSVADLERIRAVQTKESGSYAFEALYQQNPTPREGAFFKISQVQIVDALPVGSRHVRGWDFGASHKGDYTAGVKLAKDTAGLFYVVDARRGRWLPDERNAMVKQTAALDGARTRIHIPQDPGQAGVDQVQALTRLLAGFPVTTARVTGDKMTRADSFAAQLNAGNVRLIRGVWNAAFIEELRTFPLGRNDDQVDAVAAAFNELTRPHVGVPGVLSQGSAKGWINQPR